MAKDFPNIELSDAINMSQGLGIRPFAMGDNYAAVELAPANRNRQEWTWVWADITQAQFDTLRKFFIEDASDFIRWTPPGQSTELKFRPLGNSIQGAFSGFDNTRITIRVSQVFVNG